jgi:putative ribosome biogenesis GTPase RsgA
MTHPDGSEVVDVVSITEQEKIQVSKLMGTVTEQLKSLFGSSSAGKSALLAWLTSVEASSNVSSNEKEMSKKDAKQQH